jgi:hypothetical protein
MEDLRLFRRHELNFGLQAVHALKVTFRDGAIAPNIRSKSLSAISVTSARSSGVIIGVS